LAIILDGKPHLCTEVHEPDNSKSQRATFEGIGSWCWDVKNFVLYIDSSKFKRKLNMIIIKSQYDKEKDAIKVEIIKTKTSIKALLSMAVISSTSDYFSDTTGKEGKRYLVRNLLAPKVNDYNSFMFDVDFINQEKIVLYLSDYDKVDYLRQKLGSLFSAISDVKISFSRKEVTRIVEVINHE
jgi:hypothetical protein